MNPAPRRVAHRVGIAVAALAALAAGCYGAGARINTSRSIPIGLYWISGAPVQKGAYVMFCPPPLRLFDDAKERGYIGAGFCPGGYGYMMKRVSAAEGDAIAIDAAGVRVNGALLPHSAPIAADGAGRPLPRYRPQRYTLGDAEVLLMSEASVTSFDSRYFGPIERSQIATVIRPVITW